MRDDEAILLVGLGAVVIATALKPERAAAFSDLAWTWPLPRRGGRTPLITQGYSYPRHRGADIMYAAAGAPASWARAKPLNPLVAPLFAAPIGGAVIAALPGKVWNVGSGDRGEWVMLDHGEFGERITTWYQHLNRVDVAKGQRVEAGQVLGGMGADPTDAQHVVHLHFEVSRWDEPGKPSQIDPAPFLRGARYVDA
jgi:murein DD-endopeptidase MepM/ murein hydrolase activator NlpD